jgi:ATP-dependent DNA helicase DinG
LFVQGDAPRDILLHRFRNTPHAVLLGTSSFWEGVDVRGEALSCVIIDKLPFASPGDPVLKARIDAMRKLGINAFMEYQLPDAVIALKQGAGRLIRDVHDRGVLMICDPRLLNKPYGRLFLDSLPPMSRTRDPQQVEEFFALQADAAKSQSTVA